MRKHIEHSDEDKTHCESTTITSCEVPHIQNGNIINTFSNNTEKVGSFYADIDPVEVKCNENYLLLVVGECECTFYENYENFVIVTFKFL